MGHACWRIVTSILTVWWKSERPLYPLWLTRGSHGVCVVPPLWEGDQHVVSSPFVAMPSTAALKISLCFSYVQSVVWIVPRKGNLPRLAMLATDDSLALVICQLLTLLSVTRMKSKYFECQPSKVFWMTSSLPTDWGHLWLADQSTHPRSEAICLSKRTFGFGGFGLLSPINMQCFLSFYDDLGTPPTWRPHSWKKNCQQATVMKIKTRQNR